MKLTQTTIAIVVLAVSLFLSTFVLYTPQANTMDDSTFNTRYALETLAALSQDQHSVFDEVNHEDVRVYLKDRLVEYLGAGNVTEFDYDKSLINTEFAGEEDWEDIDYDIHNLLGVIEGNSDTAILLVGHYDSRGHIGRTGELGESYGAADDGYAIATMLEIARLYADRNIENSIYILMTDAEETGLYGAHLFATQETALLANVGFVINIEARGVTGPAYMFETSVNNDKVIDFYTNANMPVSYSLATAVYTVMPNSTDFTEFLALDITGVNFAVLNGLEYYHTPFDNYTNVDPSSIQHYGEQIVPLVEEFVTNYEYNDVDYFVADSNQVFFTLFTNVFIHYNENTGTVMHILFLLAMIGLVVYLFLGKKVQIRSFAKASGLFTMMMVIAIIAGQVVGRIVAFYSKVPFSITYVRSSFGGLPTLITLIALAVGFYYLYQKRYVKYQKELVIVGSLFNLLLALLTGFVLSGASFLFLIVGIVGTIYLAFDTFCKKAIVKQVVYSVLILLGVLVVVPILFSLYLALTVGGLLAFGLILVFYLIVLIPLFESHKTLHA